jgi:hypothetical protein
MLRIFVFPSLFVFLSLFERNIITLISCRQLFCKKAGDMISMLLYYPKMLRIFVFLSLFVSFCLFLSSPGSGSLN